MQTAVDLTDLARFAEGFLHAADVFRLDPTGLITELITELPIYYR